MGEGNQARGKTHANQQTGQQTQEASGAPSLLTLAVGEAP